MEGNYNSGFLELWIRGPTEAAAKAVCWNYYSGN